jgi:hypothetical protein
MTDHYEEVNAVWPADTPPCTREEAARAARKLMRHFAHRESNWVRRCWVRLKPPFNDLSRGWPRLVHDVSHRVHRLGQPWRVKDHSSAHAEIELEMARYVVDNGWLRGALRAAPRPKQKQDKAAHAAAMVKRWESKVKRAKTALGKWERKVRYYGKKGLTAA